MSTNVRNASMNAEQTTTNKMGNVNSNQDYLDFFVSGAVENQLQIGALFNMDRSSLSKEQQLHLDIFLLSYFTGGSTIYELATLTQEEVTDKFIFTERFETGLVATTPNIGLVSEIIDRYRDENDLDYLLPIFLGDETSHIDKQNRADQITAYVNKTMRTIAAKLELDGNISISSNQRIFVEVLLADFAPIDYITELAGCTEEIVNHYSKLM